VCLESSTQSTTRVVIRLDLRTNLLSAFTVSLLQCSADYVFLPVFLRITAKSAMICNTEMVSKSLYSVGITELSDNVLQ